MSFSESSVLSVGSGVLAHSSHSPEARVTETLIDARETVLLTQKLRSAEQALDDERFLCSREREVFAERLKFVEKQDEAARERLAHVLRSLRAQTGEVRVAAQHTWSEEIAALQKEIQELRESEDALKIRLRASSEEAHRAAQELAEVTIARDALSTQLQLRDTERGIEARKFASLQQELQRRELDGQEQTAVSRSELALVRDERDKLQQETERLSSRVESSHRELCDWKTAADTERRGFELESMERHRSAEELLRARISSVESQATLEQQRAAQSRERLDEYRKSEVRLMDKLETAVEHRGRAEASAATLRSELTSMQARMHTEELTLSRCRDDLAGAKQQVLRNESLVTQHFLEEQDAVVQLRSKVQSELRKELRKEMCAELGQAEAVAALRAEHAERSRLQPLRDELLDSTQGKWHYAALHNEVSAELRSAREASQAAAVQLEKREWELLAELREARSSCDDVRTASLQREVADKERFELAQRQLEGEVRDLRAVADRRQIEAQTRSVEAEHRQQLAEQDFRAELQRLREQLRMEGREADLERAALKDAQDRELRLYEELRARSRELDAESYALKDAKDKERRLLDEMRVAALGYQAEDERRQFAQRGEIQDLVSEALREHDGAITARAQLHSADTAKCRLQAEYAESQDRYRHEVGVASGLQLRCTDLERQLRAAEAEIVSLRERVHQLQVEAGQLRVAQSEVVLLRDRVQQIEAESARSPTSLVLATSQLHHSSLEDEATYLREYRRRAGALETELHAAEREMRAVETQAICTKSQALREAAALQHSANVASPRSYPDRWRLESEVREEVLKRTLDIEVSAREESRHRLMEWEAQTREEARRRFKEWELTAEARFREESSVRVRGFEQLRDDANRRLADLQESLRLARENERAALEDLKRSEALRREGLVAMDALIGDARNLSYSLTSHHQVKDNLDTLVRRHGGEGGFRDGHSVITSHSCSSIVASPVRDTETSRGPPADITSVSTPSRSDCRELQSLAKELDFAIHRHQDGLNGGKSSRATSMEPAACTPLSKPAASGDAWHKGGQLGGIGSASAAASFAGSAAKHILCGSTIASNEVSLASSPLASSPAAIVCTGCGHVFTDDARLCWRCGRPRSRHSASPGHSTWDLTVTSPFSGSRSSRSARSLSMPAKLPVTTRRNLFQKSV